MASVIHSTTALVMHDPALVIGARSVRLSIVLTPRVQGVSKIIVSESCKRLADVSAPIC